MRLDISVKFVSYSDSVNRVFTGNISDSVINSFYNYCAFKYSSNNLSSMKINISIIDGNNIIGNNIIDSYSDLLFSLDELKSILITYQEKFNSLTKLK